MEPDPEGAPSAKSARRTKTRSHECERCTHECALSTGGYCQARQRLPKLVVSRSMDELTERLRNRLLESGPALSKRVYLLDGSSLQAHECVRHVG